MTTYQEGKPVLVNGRKIVPNFDWPEWYVREIRSEARAQHKRDYMDSNHTAEMYARYLAAKREINLDGANNVTLNHKWREDGTQYISSVSFFQINEYNSSPQYYSGGRWKRDPNYTPPVLIAEIKIPFAGWQPQVTESKHCELNNRGDEFYNLVIQGSRL